jgi:hypothetical protein
MQQITIGKNIKSNNNIQILFMQKLLKHLFQNALNIFFKMPKTLSTMDWPHLWFFFYKKLQNIMVFGCEQDILTLLVTLFSTYKIEKNSFQNF